MQSVGRLCQYESLIDGTLDLSDVALLNDTLAVRTDNELTIRDLLKEK
jgi:hypothetical protein